MQLLFKVLMVVTI